MDAPELGRAQGVPAFAVALAGLAAVAYSTFLLEHLLSPDIDVVNSYVSELSAVDQPYHAVYSGGDFVTGVLTIAVALVALRGTPRAGPGLRWAVTGWILLALFGLCAVGDAVFPLDCAPSLESGCALRERSGNVSFSHEFHAVTSSLVIAFGVAALAALAVAARRHGRWPALARWGLPLAAVETALALATMAAMVEGRWLGIIQRGQIAVLVLGLLTVTWALVQERRAARRRAVPPPPERAQL
ncbi:hypothetical protein Arub01_20730 [Actinomadura rubrobrunea]|uniref:DUF998 domain-containing protein n=1 Tax=Actinomadura rubrobrunea TaxID=115335 RepID=A0A9W6UUE9_9ACTN|nr:DUF998 domain-containing protein [Actinomadura rubrobrunea]GLW63829.1 hypothetical protein Arub01_20730 [Actinomadura rubrobrunea]